MPKLKVLLQFDIFYTKIAVYHLDRYLEADDVFSVRFW